MVVMPSCNAGIRIGYLAGRYPGTLGHLFSPGDQKGPFAFMPYALDNGVFGAGDKWVAEPWIKLLEWAKLSGQMPLWTLVPDAVGDRPLTLKRWTDFRKTAASYGWPLAFAVQDGMKASDVPKRADVVFVGGTTEWKWRTMAEWCRRFARVHVGRVNSFKRLVECEEAGAESADGTGWTRGDQVQWRGLEAFVRGERSGQEGLFSGDSKQSSDLRAVSL